MFDSFETFLEAGHSRLVECLALFFVPYIHEDVAILGGSILVVEQRLPLSLTLICIYMGMVSSDLALYGLGVLARRNPWVRRKLLSPRIERLTSWLSNHVILLVMLARFVPGLMFPLYIGCGLSHIPFRRFAFTTAATAAFYLALIFVLFTVFGAAIHEQLGHWTWPVALIALAIPLFVWLRGSGWALVFRASRQGARGLVSRDGHLHLNGQRVTHRGMPIVGRLPRNVARAERIPPLLFYIPLGLQWLWLGLRFWSFSLPALANPRIEIGSLWGESKSAYLDMLAEGERHWLADFVTLRRHRGADSGAADLTGAARAMAAAGLGFPIVAKPDIGWRGFGVRLVGGETELKEYLAGFPEDQVIILQRPIFFDGEAGVLYARRPGEAKGRVLALTLRYFPHVVGDGQTALRDLILDDQRSAWKAGVHFGLDSKHRPPSLNDLDRVPALGEIVRLSFIGSNRVGGLYRDGREHITEALEQRFDAISQSRPQFYYGRYDIRFESIERLREGEDFAVIEINGAGGESISVWDPMMSFAQVYRELFHQQRLLFEIGAANRARGYKAPGLYAVLRAQWRQYRLIRRYPPSG